MMALFYFIIGTIFGLELRYEFAKEFFGRKNILKNKFKIVGVLK